MSRLGIAFVLPYQGTNGIKVTNNQVGLDPDGNGSLGTLELNANKTNDNADNILKICSSVNNGTNNTAFFDNDTEAYTGMVNTEGDITVGIDSGSSYEAQVTADSLQTGDEGISFSSGGQEVIVGQETAGAVVPDATRYVNLSILGVSYKLIVST